MSTSTQHADDAGASRRLAKNTGETVCVAFAHAGLEPRGVVASGLYAAKTKFAGYCPDCGTDVASVTLRMLRAGNRNCACVDHSLCGLDARTSPPEQIAERIDRLGIVREAGLKAFSSTFFEALGPERLAAVFACSRNMNVVRKRPTQHMSRVELLELLRKMPDRAHMLRDAIQAYKNFIAKGGTDAQLIAEHPHLAPKRREITEGERDVKAIWKFFASRVKDDPRYSISDLQSEYRGARAIYETVSRRGVPLQLVFQNAARFHLKTHSPIHLPAKWVLDSPDQYMARLKVCARTARKARAMDEPGVELTAKHLDAKDGRIDLQSLVCAVIDTYARHDEVLIDKLLAKSPGIAWRALSAEAKDARIREELLEQIGFPRTMLSHRRRETQLQEVVGKVRQLGIATNNAFRERCRPLYKFLRAKGLLNEFLIEMGWPDAYVAAHARIVCKSEFEAVVANILFLAKTAFVHDRTYPGQQGTAFRYDFFLKASSVYVEAYMLRLDSEKGKAGGHSVASMYVENRRRKQGFLEGTPLAVVAIELEDFYRKDRASFVHDAYRLLLESGALEAPLSLEDLKACLDVHQSQVDPAEGELRLIRRLAALGLSEEGATAVVARIKTGISDNRVQLTAPYTFRSIPQFDAPTVFCGISRSIGAFAVRRMDKGTTLAKRYSDFEYGHWTLALEAAIDMRESCPSLQTRGKSLGKAPRTGVWHLRIKGNQVSVGQAAAMQDAAKVISGSTLADKIRAALQMIAANQSEILLTEPFVDSATATDMDRQFRISKPKQADIDMLVPLIIARMKTAGDNGGEV